MSDEAERAQTLLADKVKDVQGELVVGNTSIHLEEVHGVGEQSG